MPYFHHRSHKFFFIEFLKFCSINLTATIFVGYVMSLSLLLIFAYLREENFPIPQEKHNLSPAFVPPSKPTRGRKVKSYKISGNDVALNDVSNDQEEAHRRVKRGAVSLLSDTL